MSAEGFRKELERLINRESMENGSDTPDFILADYLAGCLANFDAALQSREKWYGRHVSQKVPLTAAVPTDLLCPTHEIPFCECVMPPHTGKESEA